MGKISKDTFKKIFVLSLLNKFPEGVYGDFRIQKLVFFLEKYCSVKPFTFVHYIYGPYSADLAKTKDLLIASGWIIPKDKGEVAAFLINAEKETISEIIHLTIQNFKKFDKYLELFVKEYGYKRSTSLKDEAYGLKEMKTTKFGEKIFEENLPDTINISFLTEDEAEDLELGLNTNFIQLLRSRMEKRSRASSSDWRTVLSNV